MAPPNVLKVLIVDDQEENIGILYSLLQEHTDYQILVASNGATALEITRSEMPDIVLLDIMMPDINGFDVCRALKADEDTAKIPIVFLSALVETEHKIEGFDVGGVDYITKPFQHKEVLARVRTHLSIAGLQQQLREQNAQLDAFAHTVAHDLKNPLHGITGNAELALIACESDDISTIRDALFNIRKIANHAADIIESLLLLAGTSRSQELYLDGFDMRMVVDSALQRVEFMIKEYGARISVPNEWPFAMGYPPWTIEIWSNYLTNALKYGGQPPEIELGVDEIHDGTRFWVRDNGPGLSVEQQAKLFVPFSRLHTDRASGHGLGLSIARQIAEKMGGRVGVESTPGQGSLFFFVLPRYVPAPVDTHFLAEYCGQRQ